MRLETSYKAGRQPLGRFQKPVRTEGLAVHHRPNLNAVDVDITGGNAFVNISHPV